MSMAGKSRSKKGRRGGRPGGLGGRLSGALRGRGGRIRTKTRRRGITARELSGFRKVTRLLKKVGMHPRGLAPRARRK